MTLKILNLYAGIGGNRKLWSGDIEVTAVELNPEIAKIYQDFFPNDKVIVADAHQYLLDHYKEFDFIWSSPPCQSHTLFNILLIKGKGIKPRYPSMILYEEIVFLQHFFNGKYVVENVKGYYEPLIKPQELYRHYFWSNFNIAKERYEKILIYNKKGFATGKIKAEKRGLNIDDIKVTSIDKRQVLNNMVNSKLGLHIFECAFRVKQTTLNYEGN